MTMTDSPLTSLNPVNNGPSSLHHIHHIHRSVNNPSSASSVVMLKTKQEIHTSLHLIKDIRRLETYQRDYFLKVKESLSAVEMMLDQQLTEMSWSNSLIDVEETLLKSTLELSSAAFTTAPSSSSQIAEMYANLSRDRETLDRRFLELITKTSLSEFVVNSRSILDVETVQAATEAILKNEKPIQVKHDKNVPIDHTFFLTNFCVTNLATGMMSRCSKQQQQQHSYDSANLSNSYRTSGSKPMEDFIGVSNGRGADHLTEPLTSKGLTPGPPSNLYYKGGTCSDVSVNGDYTSNNSSETVYNPGVSSSLFGQELVTAITQIALQEDKVPSSETVKDVKNPSVSRGNPWQVKDKEGNYYRNGFESNPEVTSSVADVSSDTISNSSNDETRSNTLDISKPLSFARIASLNLEKSGSGVRGVLGFPQPPPPLVPTLSSQRAIVAAQIYNKLQQQAAVLTTIIPPNLPPSINPRFFLDIVMEGKKLGRVIIEVEPLLAPKMSQNFQMLICGDKGFGYRGCQFFQAWKNESVICGDWEHNSGRGGRAAYENGNLFTPDDTKLPCIRGAVGMRRMSKRHSSLNQVASQFRIILANMHTQFSGIFGQVVSGLEALDKVANVGGDGGRPEKIASVQNCGIYK